MNFNLSTDRLELTIKTITTTKTATELSPNFVGCSRRELMYKKICGISPSEFAYKLHDQFEPYASWIKRITKFGHRSKAIILESLATEQFWLLVSYSSVTHTF